MPRAALVLSLCLFTAAATAAPPAPADRSAEVGAVLDEMRGYIEQAGLQEKFEQLRTVFNGRLDASEGERSFADKTGNARLKFVEQLLRNPMESIHVSEMFTRRLHEQAVASDEQGLAPLLRTAAETLDTTGFSEFGAAERPQAPAQALDLLRNGIEQARSHFDKAMATLSAEERAELREHLYAQTTDERGLGHRLKGREQGRRVVDLLEKMDRSSLHMAGMSLAPLASRGVLEALAQVEATDAVAAEAAVEGSLHAQHETPQGKILIGGRDANRYRLDELQGVAAIIDLGGDDTYEEGTLSEERPVLVIIDLAGNDTYRGTKSGIQGGAIFGVSILIDAAGDDTYDAVHVAQGSALAGVGALIDAAGNDSYRGDQRVQGHAVAGIGVLIDRAGDDRYRGAMLAQGVGGPLGLGLLDDLDGKDHYFAGGKYEGPYDDTPGFGCWSQGVGVGPRGVSNGGVGVILDGGGDDVYEYDYFSHGGAYWFAAGFARDFGGNDDRVGATREMFDGSERTEGRFVRWGTGYGCHYGAGFIIDDAGDDTYGGTFAAGAYAYDISVAAILDFAGNDSYGPPDHGGFGQGQWGGLALLYDAAGNEKFAGKPATSGIGTEERDDLPGEIPIGNFVFVINVGGEDDFGARTPDDPAKGGESGAFLISR